MPLLLTNLYVISLMAQRLLRRTQKIKTSRMHFVYPKRSSSRRGGGACAALVRGLRQWVGTLASPWPTVSPTLLYRSHLNRGDAKVPASIPCDPGRRKRRHNVTTITIPDLLQHGSDPGRRKRPH